jgi:hypothetical protein
MSNSTGAGRSFIPRLGLLIPVGLIAAVAGSVWWATSDDGASEVPAADASGQAEVTAALPAPSGFPSIARFVEPLRGIFDGQSERVAGAAIDTQLGLVSTYWAANGSEAMSSVIPGSTPAVRFDVEAATYITEYGIDAYRDAAWLAWPKFERELRGLLERATAEGRTVSSLLADPSDPSVQGYFEACGDFHLLALSTGLITEQGALTVPPEIVTALFLYRWNNLVSQIVPVEQSLAPVVLQAVLRWRIEVAQGLTPARRLQFAADYASMFPDDQAPGDERTRAILEALVSASAPAAGQKK